MRPLQATTCYHCDATPSGAEHVPPKCLFPPGGNWSHLITVPSCAQHNNATSVADEHLRFLLGAACSGVPDAIVGGAARAVVRLAVKRSRSLPRYGAQLDGNTLALDRDFPLDIELLRTALRKIARAIYFHHHGGRRKLLGELHAVPLFVPVDASADADFVASVERLRAITADELRSEPRHGTHQEIFAYQIFEHGGTVTVNLEFYGAHRATVFGLA